MKAVTPNFYFISETSKSLSARSRSFKKIYRVKKFCANVLKLEEREEQVEI